MVRFYPTCRSMMHSAGLCLLGFCLLVLSSGNAAAHRMKVFAWVDGQTIGGEAYFMGGEVIANATIELRAEQQVVATTQSDNAGQFRLAAVTPGDYQIRADAGQGHVASFAIAQTEFATEAPAVTAITTDSTVASPAVTCVLTSVLTSAQLETAIAKAIRPLREEIDQYEAKVRMHDVLGGIGYILGLFGFWMLLRSRRQ